MTARKYFPFLVLVLLVLPFIFSNCSSTEVPDPVPIRGCTDPDAENFDSTAEVDDSTCTYFAVAFVGNYIANDTAFVFGTNDVASTRTFAFAVSRSGPQQIQTTGLDIGGCEQPLNFNMSNTTFVLLSQACSEDNFVGRVDGTTLSYTYEFQINPMDRRLFRGVAIKQQ